MGISIPIGAEHYKNLKEISDKLGLGLKRTVEYLVSYYWQKEMVNNTVTVTKREEPLKDMTKEERYREIVAASFAQTTSTAIPAPTIPPSNISAKSIWENQPKPIKNKVLITESKIIDQICSSCGSPNRISAKYCCNCGRPLQFLSDNAKRIQSAKY